MNARDRAPLNLEDEDDDLDLAQFTPKDGPGNVRPPAPGEAALRELGTEQGFLSRQAGVRRRRRHRSGRNEQINIKTTAAYADRFYRIAERQDWMCAVVFERAIEALEQELAAEQPEPRRAGEARERRGS